MPHIAWYLFLTSGSLLLFVFTLWKSFIPRARAMIVFFSFCGSAYILEYVIKILFHSYDYYPHILNNKWFDSLLGATISQAIAVPTIAMCITAFRLNILWIIGFCFLLMGIETLFLSLEIYEHHWWKTIYTGVLTFIGFYLAKWWDRLMMERKPWMDWVNIYLFLIFFSNTIMYSLTAFTESHLYHIGVFEHPARDSVFIEATFIFIHSIVVSFIILRPFKWLWFIGIYLFDLIVLVFFERIKLIQFFDLWNPFLYACLPVGVALLTFWIYAQLVKRLYPTS